MTGAETLDTLRQLNVLAPQWQTLDAAGVADVAVRRGARDEELSGLLQLAGDLRVAYAASSGHPAAESLRVVTLDEFAAVDEPGAEALVGGDSEHALIPVNGDVVMYGDGGAGKTTLAVDLACHLAAGDAWLEITIGRPAIVLLIENEGPRPHFRGKLRRKRDAWQGSPLADRVLLIEEPWSVLTLADETHRAALADVIREHHVDVVVLGPVTRSGMNEAGTLQEVRDFLMLVCDVRTQACRRVTFLLVHHENKAGQVSGAWEGATDTVLHVQAQGHGRTRLYVQKARWSSSHHATALQLAWQDGDGFAVREAAERDDTTVADEILAVVAANGGASWNTVEKAVAGKGDRLRMIRDRLLAGGDLVNAATGRGMKLWHVDDPARPTEPEQLRPDRDAPGTHPASATGDEAGAATASLRPRCIGTQDAGTHLSPPPEPETAP